MRILIVTNYFPPQNSIAVHRPYSWAKAWSAAGHEVSVLTVARRPIGPDVGLPPLASVRVERLPLLPGRQVSQRRATMDAPLDGSIASRLVRLKWRTGVGLVRAPHPAMLWAPRATSWARKHGPWDLVVSTAPPFPVHAVGASLARSGATRRWVADYRDRWSNNQVWGGLPVIRAFERAVERRLLRSADRVVAVSAIDAEALGTLSSAPVSVVENGFDPDDFSNLPPGIFPDDGMIRLAYVGTLYVDKDDPRPLIKALHALRGTHDWARRIRLAFVGVARELDRIIEETRSSAFVESYGARPRPEALRAMVDADALVLFQRGRGVPTGKVFEYFGSGSDVLVVGETLEASASDYVARSGAGWTAPPEPGALAPILRSLVDGHPAADDRDVRLFERRRLAMRMLDLAFSE